jgi:farnesyl-diphosphate farnesyltransferase
MIILSGLIKLLNLIKLKMTKELSDIEYCYLMLDRVSRSFSMVIKELPSNLKDVICIFYLILRGLDSIEDDMNYPKEKIIKNWSIENIGDSIDNQNLLKDFYRIIKIFHSIDLKYQKIIVDITDKMGNGMADFISSNSSIDTIENYNLYCYYVAGLVGDGLTSLFNSSQLEFNLNKELSYHMGLFLQKTNIIRDYYEDIHQGRIWWPKQIWSIYSLNIFYFKNNPKDKQSIECLNHMIKDSLNHLPYIINYLIQIQNNQIFKFCSIPQIMALATLSLLYNNHLVFTSNVKISKYLSYQIMFYSNNLNDIYYWIHFFLTKIENQIENDKDLFNLIEEIKQMCIQSS